MGWKVAGLHPVVVRLKKRFMGLGIPERESLAMATRWVWDNGPDVVSRWLRPRSSRGRVTPRGSGHKGESR